MRKMKDSKKPVFSIQSWESVSKLILLQAVENISSLSTIRSGDKVFIKPNFTFPFFKKGVTTPPDLLRAVVEILVEKGANVTIGEGGASLDVFDLDDSFKDHGVYDLQREYGIKVTHLRDEEIVYKDFSPKKAGRRVPLPKVLMEDTDLFITLPVPKMHAMTTVSLAFKNQWGCIAAHKRFLFHPCFNEIIAGIHQILPPQLVICDGRYVLTDNGPMFGKMENGAFLAVANHIGAFDVAMCRLMGYDHMKIDHLRFMVRAGLAPERWTEIDCNADPADFSPFKFKLKRTFQNYIALAGFRSSLITWFGYDSFASNLLHKILYAIKPNPLDVEVAERNRSRRSTS
jgi:uncharacterized protein (DUF362 family)